MVEEMVQDLTMVGLEIWGILEDLKMVGVWGRISISKIYIYKEARRSLLHDLIPFFCVSYLFTFLDRTVETVAICISLSEIKLLNLWKILNYRNSWSKCIHTCINRLNNECGKL